MRGTDRNEEPAFITSRRTLSITLTGVEPPTGVTSFCWWPLFFYFGLQLCHLSTCLFQFFQTLSGKHLGRLSSCGGCLTLLLPLLSRPTTLCSKLPLLFELCLHGLVLALPTIATDPKRPS